MSNVQNEAYLFHNSGLIFFCLPEKYDRAAWNAKRKEIKWRPLRIASPPFPRENLESLLK